jgi:DnaJ-class molecular chaperone
MTNRKKPMRQSYRSSADRLMEIFRKINQGEATELICQPCDGTGQIGDEKCKFCFGSGIAEMRLLYDDGKPVD